MRSAVVAAALVVAFLAGGCDRGDGSGPADDRLAVVASFYPVFEAARVVGGDAAQVTNLTPAGTEPHDLELAPDQVDELEDADVLLYLGRDFQPAVEKVAERADGVSLDVLRVVDVRDGDPHVWLDPLRLSAITGEVAEAFARADPGRADTYRSNASAHIERLGALDGEMRAGLQNCSRRRIVTSHAAFGYLAERYGLTQESIAGISPEAEPDPKHLAELTDRVRADGTTTVFSETLASPRVAETLAREAGVSVAVLNPIEGLTPAQQRAGETYVSIMRANLATLRQALACP